MAMTRRPYPSYLDSSIRLSVYGVFGGDDYICLAGPSSYAPRGQLCLRSPLNTERCQLESGHIAQGMQVDCCDPTPVLIFHVNA